jgi:transposase-like protein
MKSWPHVFFKNRSGRRRWTLKQRQRLLARFHESQLTQRDFAGRHGVGLSTLNKWLRVESETPSPPLKFQEVTLHNMPMRCAVEVVSPQGWTVRLQNGSEIETLPQLLQALPC